MAGSEELAERALEGVGVYGASDVTLYLPGEPPQLEILWHAAVPPAAALTVRIKTYPDGQPLGASTTSVTLPAAGR